MPQKPRVHTACNHANTVNSQRLGTIEELQNIQQPLLMGTTTMPPAATAMSLFMWQTVSRILSGTATGRRLQLSGGYFANRMPDVAWHNNIRAELWRKLAVTV